MTLSAAPTADDAAEERRTAMRALLAAPFVDADSPAFRLVRRHEHDLRRLALDVFGYQLELASTAARLLGSPTAAGLRRPLRVRPASASGRARPLDEWPALSDRGCVLLFLTLAALERGGAQTVIAELAREVELAGADVDPPISLDFRERSERVAFADGLDLLCAWGVLEHTAGTRQSFARREQDPDEALLTVDRRRLAITISIRRWRWRRGRCLSWPTTAQATRRRPKASGGDGSARSRDGSSKIPRWCSTTSTRTTASTSSRNVRA